MTYPLSKAPDGLLGTLDLKTLGKNPQDLSEVLSPSLEVLPFYLLRNRFGVKGSGAFVAVGTGIVLANAAQPQYFSAAGNFVVPMTETIRVKSIAVTCIRAAADAALTLEYAVHVRRVTGIATIALGSGIFGPRPATDLGGVQAIELTEPLWLGPGDFLRLVPNTTQTAAGSTIFLELDIDTVPSG